MNSIRNAILLVLLLSLSTGLFAGGFALSGIGSRAISMGGAFRGMADDPSAVYWNPAGLAFIRNDQLSLGGSFIKPDSRWTNNIPLPGFAYNKELSAENKLSIFPSLLGFYADNPKTKFGLGIYVPYGLGATYDAYDIANTGFVMPDTLPNGTPIPADYILTTPSGMPKNEMSSSIAIVDIHPTMSHRLLDKLSFGLGFSLFYGMIDVTRLSPSDRFSLYGPDTFEMSSTGWGFGGNIGVLYKPIDKLSLGLTYKTPANIPLEGEAEVKLWLNSYHNYLVQLSASSPNPVWAPGVHGGKGDLEANLKLPAEAALGISCKVMPNWSVNLDYAYSMWSRLNRIEVTFLDDVAILDRKVENPKLVFDWKDTSRVSLGSEYRLGRNALRAGFYYDQSPIPEETQNPTLSDIGDKISCNIGYGHDFGKLTLDVNGQIIKFPERVIDTETDNNMRGTYNSSVMAANLGLTYTF